MLHTTLFVAITALIAGSSAAAIPDPNVRYGQLRLYGKPGCFDLNLGELGIFGTDVNTCQTFNSGDVVRSVAFENNPYGCKLQIYSDLKCHLDRHDVVVKECLSGDKQYRSYKLICNV